MLIGLHEALGWAKDKNAALAAVNTPFFEGLLATIDAAERGGVPVILQFAQVHEPLVSIDEIGPAMVELAKRSSAPFVVHVDHGEDIEYIRRGLDIGFNSAMFDGSHLSTEENIARTREVVDLCNGSGIGVEGEIGVMTGNENGDPSQGVADESLYTDPALAAEFVERTGVTCLAASFGTVHGVYHQQPKLNYALIEELTSRTGVPIVMHGGSGLSVDEYAAAIQHGVRKINYYTYAAKAAMEAARAVAADESAVLFPSIAKAAREAVAADVSRFIDCLSNR